MHLFTAIKYILLSTFILITLPLANAQEMSIKQIVQTYYANKPLYVGASGDWKSFGLQSIEILDREFSYATPANDFKQPYIHPDPYTWKWIKSDDWITHCATTNQILRLHSPISPQCSDWAEDDTRTAAELLQNEQEYLTELYKRYGNEPCVQWLDVVNETIVTNKITDPLGNQYPGDWFGPRAGIGKWENPWPTIGIDNTTSLKVPLYIDKAFELADKFAPTKKHIINQHGDFQDIEWEKIKLLVNYLRNRNRKVDGIGWQAHINLGWEKTAGNLSRLSSFVDWCHQNNLEFHITEFNVWDPSNSNRQGQADTFGAIVQLLLSKLKTGTIGINFWGIKDEDTGNPTWYGTLWDNTGTPKLAYNRVKQELINAAITNSNTSTNANAVKLTVNKLGELSVYGLVENEVITILHANGTVISAIKANNQIAHYTLPSHGCYIVKTAKKAYKVLY